MAILLLIKTYDRHLYIVFLNLKADFNTVDHASLCKILTILEAPRKMTTLLKNLYSDAEICMRVDGKNSTWFSIKSGVRQGCVQ